MKMIAGILVAVLLATGAWADANARANELFVEAVQLWKQAEALEGDGLQALEAKLTLLSQVDANLDSIVSDHPSSNLAVQLMIGAVGPLEAGQVKAMVAGMVMRGPGPNLQERARGSEKVSGLPDPDHFDHLPMQIMSSSQLGGPSARSRPCQAPISTGPR